MKILNLIKIILLSTILLPILIASAGFLDDVKKAAEVQKSKKACEQNNDANACFKAGEIILTNPHPALKEAEALYKKGCELGHAEACFKAGEIASKNPNTEKESLALWTKGCELQNLNSCTKMGDKGDLKMAFKAGQLSNDKEGRLKWFGKVCLGGEVNGCEALCIRELFNDEVDGCMSLFYKSVEKNPHVYEMSDEQMKWTLKACNYGNLKGCTMAGYFAKDPVEGIRLLTKSCSKDDELYADACNKLGSIYRESGDLKKAEYYYGLACQDTFEDSCEILKEIKKEIADIKNKEAEMAAQAKKQEMNAKLAPLKAACDSGDLNGCIQYGLTMEAPHDQKISWFKKACDGGVMEGCFRIGSSLFDLGKINDALNWYIKACNGDNNNGCFFAGWSYANKLNKPADAKKYFILGCNLNHPQACNDLGSMESKKGNTAEAAKYYAKSCDVGYKTGCNNLASLQIDWNSITEARKNLNEACDAGSNAACRKLVALTKEFK